MTSRRLKPADLPDWPRRLSRELAAAYCGMSPNAFDEEVKARRYPPPIRKGRRVMWSKVALDAALDAEEGLAEPLPSSASDPFLERLSAYGERRAARG